jgi:HEAT repeat protein
MSMLMRVALVAFIVAMAGPASPAPEDREAEPSYKGKTASQWIETLESGPIGARRRAVYALWKLVPNAPDVGPVLTKAFVDKDKYLRDTATQALLKLRGNTDEARKAVPGLAAALGDERLDVRRGAVNILYQMGPHVSAAAVALLGALKDDDAAIRSNAAAAIGTCVRSVKGAAPVLVALLADPDEQVRLFAAKALNGVRPDLIVEPILPRLAEEDPKRRVEAAKLLGYAMERGDAALPALIEALGDENAEVRLMAVGALGVMNPSKAAKDLAKLIGDDDVRVRKAVVQSLGRARGAKAIALKALAKVAGDEDHQVAGPALRAMKDLDASAGVPTFLAALSSENPLVKAAALLALGSAGDKADAVVPAIVAALADESSTVRGAAFSALRTLGEKAGAALPALLARAREEASPDRAGALGALAYISPGSKTVLKTLVSALTDADPTIAMCAESALAVLGRVAAPAVPALITRLETPTETFMRQRTADALGAIGPPARAAEAALVAVLDGEGFARLTAALALCRIRAKCAPRAVEVLITALADERERRYALGLLGKAGSVAKTALPALEKMMTAGPDHVRAAEAFALIAGPEKHGTAVTTLSTLLTDGYAWALAKEDAAITLGKLGPSATSSVPSLVKALDSPNPFLRREAARALGMIGPEAKAALAKLREMAEEEIGQNRSLAKEAIALIEVR